MVEFECNANLVGLQPNPEVASAFVHGAMERAAQLVAAGRFADLATSLERLVAVTASLRERRPEVSALVDAALSEFATPEFAAALFAQHGQSPESQSTALRLIDALGPAIAPSLLSLLDTHPNSAAAAVALMCERASLFAGSLAENVATYNRAVLPHIARVLGHAGEGFEEHIYGLCDQKDEKTTREALRSLSRIGSERAAELVGMIARDAKDWMSTATVETLLRFPTDVGGRAIRDVLSHRPFVIAQPAAASRLIGRAAQSRVSNLEPVLRDLLSLRYRFWNRALVQVANDANALLKR
jgi:hypothetical protein